MYYDYGMSPVNEVTGKKEVYSAQSDNQNSTAANSNGTVPVGQQGVYYSENTQQSTGVVNSYGGDIANFGNFKKDDRSVAMSGTNEVATDVKMAYMELQHDYPDVVITFEPMPDPKTCGKGREGFHQYMNQLDNWKELAMMQIKNKRDISARELAGAIMANDDQNREMGIAATVATGTDVFNAIYDTRDDIIDNDDKNTAAIKTAVHNEGAQTRGIVRQEGEKNREALRKEEEQTRQDIKTEGELTRKTVAKEAESTRDEIQKEANRIIDTLDPTGFNQAIQSIRDAAKAKGKAIDDFIRENPALPFVAGLPLGSAVLVPKVRNALGL